jgi:hypothetical protein
MAQVVMTDAQKEQLVNDPNFQLQVKWSILDQAAYYRGLDGTSQVGAAALQTWAQSRPLAAQIIGNPTIADGGVMQSYHFVETISQMGLSCWDNVANSTTSAIAWLLANNYFGPNALAQAWFKQQVYQSPW